MSPFPAMLDTVHIVEVKQPFMSKGFYLLTMTTMFFHFHFK